MPSLPVVIYPTPVQGDGAALKIAEAIQTAATRAECAVLILCRGGGNIEDLWAFNEEIVARAIAACSIPIICGVGHETDFTIADFVADARAPTPTGAAQLACPEREELLQRMANLCSRMHRIMQRGIESRMQETEILARRLVHPGEQIRNQLIHLQHSRERLAGAWLQYSESRHWRLRELSQRFAAARPDISRLIEQQHELGVRLRRAVARRDETLAMILQRQQAHLAHLNPKSVLERGYSIAYAADGTILRDSDQVSIGDNIWVTFATGWSKASVSEKGK